MEARSMDWSRLISDRRLGLEEYHEERHHTRSDFQRDYDRLIFSSPFRRLQNKTQVFPLPGSIFVHNRLTHSLEVSSVGRSMAREAAIGLAERYGGKSPIGKPEDMGDIVAAACLAHDLGNPPFGHSGEKTIAAWFSDGKGAGILSELTPRQQSDFRNFEGNANSFRLLTHRFAGRRTGGMAMTYSTLAATVKYPYSSEYAGKKGKFGFFESEEGTYRRVADWLGIPELSPGRFCRHPLVYIMEAADDICYQIMDMEDAHKLKIMPEREVTELFMNFFDENHRERSRKTMQRLDDPNERIAYLRSKVIGELVGACAAAFVENEGKILRGEEIGNLTGLMPSRLRDAYQECSNEAWAHIYCAPDVVNVELAGSRILTYLLDMMMDAVMNPDKNYSRLMLNIIPQQYETRAETLYERIQSVLDHLSGMTDVYALDLYRRLNGHTLPNV